MLTILKQFNTQAREKLGRLKKRDAFFVNFYSHQLLQLTISDYSSHSHVVYLLWHIWGARNDYSEILKLPSTLLGGLSLLYGDVGVACILSFSLLLVVSYVQPPVSLTMWQEKHTQFLPFFFSATAYRLLCEVGKFVECSSLFRQN
jgi:hypothetical protein